MKVVYFDCISGAAGDMLLGALLDSGVPFPFVHRQLEGLNLAGWRLTTDLVERRSIAARKANVTVSGHQSARNYAEIRALLGRAQLNDGVRRRAEQTFRLLAEAEAAVHGTTPEEVHFHEVGAVDAIVDIVGVSAALEYLSPDLVVTSPIPTGRGSTLGAHGPLPVPSPAVVKLLSGAILVERGDLELVTPTGAALLAANTDRFGSMPPMRITSSGFGAGDLDLESPNVTRVVLGELVEAVAPEEGVHALVIETNIDDMSPELFPYVIGELLGAGADDAWITPIVMKKGRPGFTLSALVSEHERDRVLDVLYRETTTLGTRSYRVAKDALERSWREVSVGGQTLRVKVGFRGGEIVTASPEHDDAVKVARATGMALKDVYEAALRSVRSDL